MQGQKASLEVGTLVRESSSHYVVKENYAVRNLETEMYERVVEIYKENTHVAELLMLMLLFYVHACWRKKAMVFLTL